MKNKGSIYAGFLIFCMLFLLFIIFFGITIFQTIVVGEFNNIKNDMYLINRNVLLSLQRDIMGEDKKAFYEDEVKKLIEEEIKRQWKLDVSRVSEKGLIRNVTVDNAKIITLENKMYIESVFNIELRPVIFKDLLNEKLVFKASESVKVEKMKGWNDD